MVTSDYSSKKISKTLVEEIKRSLRSIESYGSVEIYIQNNTVTQITTRSIKKTINGERKDITNKK